MPRNNKDEEKKLSAAGVPPAGENPPGKEPEEKMVEISAKEWNDVQQTMKMLKEVADKGRVFNYENSRPQKKSTRVKLSVLDGKVITGWRTLKDELIKHPTTGKTVGEKQEYELSLLGSDGVLSRVVVDGYEKFSAVRYGERVEAEVTARKEDWEGNFTFDVRLPDGRTVQLDSRFIN